MHKIFNGLNNKQIKAAETCDGVVRITAGAGSGKTKTLVHHYAYLVEEMGISPSSLLTITFTNKAANEMKDRIARLIGKENFSDEFICTIHSLCVKILRKEIFRIGYPSNFSICDDGDNKDIAGMVIDELGLEDKMKASELVAEVGKFKAGNDYITNYILAYAGVSSTDPIIRHIQYQRKYYHLDFDDLLLFAENILSKYPEALDDWSFFNYVMVDEAHDCNPWDWSIIKMLSSKSGNLWVLGDYRQSIYQFRNAAPHLLYDMKPDIDLELDQNYRSTQQILNPANSIIRQNTKNMGGDMFTENPDGDKPIVFEADSDNNEANYVIDIIKKGLKEGALPSDFAILYRASYLSRKFEQYLISNGIKYVIWGGVRFYDRKEVKDLLSYLKVASNGDDIAFRRVINTPARKFGRVSMEKLSAMSEASGKTMYDVLKENRSMFIKSEAGKFVTIIEHARSLLKSGKSISEVSADLFERSGLKKLYEKDSDKDRVENVNELINSMREYEASNKNEEVSLAKYFQDISLFTNQSKKSDETMVKLMTIHQSKGLEFPIVFIVGCNDGIFPSSRTITEMGNEGTEEERRLMYVAITRAMKKLYITYSKGYSWFTNTDKEPSRFIDEAKDGDFVFVKDNGKYASAENKKKKYEAKPVSKWTLNSPDADANIGQKVLHKYFGEGTIIASNKKSRTYTVQFKTGVKTVVTGSVTKT